MSDQDHKSETAHADCLQRPGSAWDFYAAHALSGILSRNLSPNDCGNNHINHANVRGPRLIDAVEEACRVADEMLKQRAKRKLPNEKGQR